MLQCLLILCARYFKSRINMRLICFSTWNVYFYKILFSFRIRNEFRFVKKERRREIRLVCVLHGGYAWTWNDFQVFSGLEKWFVHFITICNFCVRTRYYFSFGNCVDSSGFVWWVQSFCVDIFCVGQTDNLLSQAARTTQLELHTKHWPRRETFERT